LIIDFHAHTSDRPMHSLHVTSASIATLEAEAKQYSVSMIVLLATYFPHKKSGVYNLDMLERIKGRPLFRMFGSLDVMNHLDSGLVELKTLAEENKIAGIKLYPGYQGFEPSEKRLEAVYALAEKYRLPVMLHGGEVHHCAKELTELARPSYVEKPAREHLKVKFVVSHLANPYFSELRGVMSRCPNVFTDISGQFVSGSSEDTEEYREEIVCEIQQFLLCPNGYKRVLFATDFPIQSYKDSLDLVRRLQLTTEQSKNVMAENALRVLDQAYVP
jgi:uncharacterized protein